MGRLDGKVAIVTGAARGQGLAAAQAFAAEGARVVLADILDAEGKEAANAIGEAAHYVHLDVTREEDWTAAVDETVTRFGGLHVLFNNAGILVIAPMEAMTLEQYMKIVAVNQAGTFLGMRAAASAMRDSGGGSIINTSSVEGLRGGAGLVAYGASKFAVRGMTKAAAVELGPSIRVNSIHPGVVDTPMLHAQGVPPGMTDKLGAAIPAKRAGKPAEIAALAVFLASDDSSYCTGAEFVADGGATTFIGWGGAVPRF